MPHLLPGDRRTAGIRPERRPDRAGRGRPAAGATVAAHQGEPVAIWIVRLPSVANEPLQAGGVLDRH